MEAKYSFIVPTYNSEKWIKECVDSILAQTYKNFNLIILDSGSEDGTLSWIKSLNDGRITIYETAQRLSIVENWSRIISVPRNEFMTIAGHDDVFYPDYLETIDELILENPHGGLYQTQFNFIGSEGDIIRKCKDMPGKMGGYQFLETIFKNNIEVTATGFMVKSADYDRIGGIPAYPDLLYADIALWHQLISIQPLFVSPKTCFGFRTHSENTSKSFTRSRLVSFEMLVNYIKQIKETDTRYHDLVITHGRTFLESFVKGSCNKLIYVPKNKRNNVTMQSISECGERCAASLLGDAKFYPHHSMTVILSRLIDNSTILRHLFLFLKSFRKRIY